MTWGADDIDRSRGSESDSGRGVLLAGDATAARLASPECARFVRKVCTEASQLRVPESADSQDQATFATEEFAKERFVSRQGQVCCFVVVVCFLLLLVWIVEFSCSLPFFVLNLIFMSLPFLLNLISLSFVFECVIFVAFNYFC